MTKDTDIWRGCSLCAYFQKILKVNREDRLLQVGICANEKSPDFQHIVTERHGCKTK